jgi:hypothetical protein
MRNVISNILSLCGFTSAAIILLCVFAGAAFSDRSPAIDPPRIVAEAKRTHLERSDLNLSDAMTEWTLHKTADGAHPDSNEQQMLWLMNRARANPTPEGIWLAGMTAPDVQGAVSYFGVDLQLLQQEFAAIAPKPPGAFDARLYEAAVEHSEYLIAIEGQNHDGQFDRIRDAGFVYTAGRGNVFSWGNSALHAHAAFNIDWGPSGDGSGMQDGRGHRMAIMSVDGDYTNVGLAAVPSDNSVGPLVITGNFAKAATWEPDHCNVFIVGTVWEDGNGNDMYDPDEGVGGVTVMPDHGSYYAITADSGGYAIPAAPGAYWVEFVLPSASSGPVKTVTVTDQSVLCDYIISEALPGDMNDDGDVDGRDAFLFATAFKYFEPAADVNDSGSVGVDDIEVFAAAFGVGGQ